MKYAEKYLEEVVKIKPLGKLTTQEDVVADLSGEMVYIDGKCSDIFISHADYANWLETIEGGISPRAQWKPNLEQMEALWGAAEKYLEDDNKIVRELKGKVLETLYHDLKDKL